VYFAVWLSVYFAIRATEKRLNKEIDKK